MQTNRTAIAATSPSANRHNRVVARMALAGVLAAGIGSFAIAAPASAETCTGKNISASYNGQVIHGTCGNDHIKANNYSVTIYAGDGNDEVKAGWGGGKVTAYLGNGDDDLYNGSDKQLVVKGDAGHDYIEGGNYDDNIQGGNGNDEIFGGNGKDALYGQNGDDTLNSDSYGTLVKGTVDGGADKDKAVGDLKVDSFTNVESKSEGSL